MTDENIDKVINEIYEYFSKFSLEELKNKFSYWANKEEYLKLLVAGEIDYEEKNIYDLMEKIKNNKKIILKIKLFRDFLKSDNEELRKDKEIVIEVVKQDGRALEYASEELKSDKEIVIEAVKQNGEALIYASDRLKNDAELIELSNKHKYYFINYYE